MGPGIIVAGAALAGLWLWSRAGGGRRNTTETQTSAQSGYTWRLDSNTESGNTYVMVTAPSEQFGAVGQGMTVLTYAVPAGKSFPRTLVSYGLSVPREMIDAAIRDYSITVPPGVTLPAKAADKTSYQTARGRSGMTWNVVQVGGTTTVYTGADEATSGVAIQYRDNPTDAEHPRVLTMVVPYQRRTIIDQALSDFDVSVPKGMQLPG